MKPFGGKVWKIEFEQIHNAAQLSDFVCGIPKIDEFIHTRLQEFMDKTSCETYLIWAEDQIVAMLSIGNGSLTLDDDSKNDMKQGFVDKPAVALKDSSYFQATDFPSVEILYLAVSEKLRKQNIGRNILRQIEKRIKRERPNCQFLTVDAYMEKEYSAVPFYSKCGFDYAEYPHGGYKDTLRMYKVISPVNVG